MGCTWALMELRSPMARKPPVFFPPNPCSPQGSMYSHQLACCRQSLCPMQPGGIQHSILMRGLIMEIVFLDCFQLYHHAMTKRKQRESQILNRLQHLKTNRYCNVQIHKHSNTRNSSCAKQLFIPHEIRLEAFVNSMVKPTLADWQMVGCEPNDAKCISFLFQLRTAGTSQGRRRDVARTAPCRLAQKEPVLVAKVLRRLRSENYGEFTHRKATEFRAPCFLLLLNV